MPTMPKSQFLDQFPASFLSVWQLSTADDFATLPSPHEKCLPGRPGDGSTMSRKRQHLTCKTFYWFSFGTLKYEDFMFANAHPQSYEYSLIIIK